MNSSGGLFPAIETAEVRLASESQMVRAVEGRMTDGFMSKSSKYSVDETLSRLKNILAEKKIAVFALIDHSGEAEMAGLSMRPTKLLIFGNPKGGTPLMVAAPTIAIDLPLKILIWQDADGHVWVSYNSPDYLAQRHQLPHDLVANIAFVETLAATIAG
jgi:uncharacterized protein (DUF302 family)